MANGTFNIALGREREFYETVRNNVQANSALVFTFLQATVADDALQDFDDFAAMLADAGVDEADFTNFARVELTDADLTAPTIDDALNQVRLDIPDIEFANAGGASNNTLVKAVIGFDPDTTAGTDSDIIPITHHDVTFTTQGLTFNVNVSASGFLIVG